LKRLYKFGTSTGNGGSTVVNKELLSDVSIIRNEIMDAGRNTLKLTGTGMF